MKMATYITLDVAPTRSGQIKWGPTVTVKPGSTLPLYVTAISDDKYALSLSLIISLSRMIRCTGPNINPGDYLIGSLTLSKNESVKKRVSPSSLSLSSVCTLIHYRYIILFSILLALKLSKAPVILLVVELARRKIKKMNMKKLSKTLDYYG